LKYSLLVHRGRNAEGVGLAQTMGAGQYRRRDLLKMSKNVLFDEASFEDLKRFSGCQNNDVESKDNRFQSIERRRQV